MGHQVSLNKKVNLRIFWVVTLVSVVTGAFSFYKSREEINGRLAEEARGALGRLSISLPEAIWNFDQEAIKRILKAEFGIPSIKTIVLWNTNGDPTSLTRSVNGDLLSSARVPESDVKVEAELFYKAQ